jgi:hypothetical protein
MRLQRVEDLEADKIAGKLVNLPVETITNATFESIDF